MKPGQAGAFQEQPCLQPIHPTDVSALPLPQPLKTFLLGLRLNLYLLQELCSYAQVWFSCSTFQPLADIPVLIPGNRDPLPG